MDEKKTLYKLGNYWKNTILDSAKILSYANRRPDDCKDFIHLGDDIFIDVEDLLSWIENLNYEVEHLQDELREVKQDMEDNCVRKTAWEDSGMSIHDFI